MSVYLSLCVYIFSLLLAALLLITGKARSQQWVTAGLIVHALALALYLIDRFRESDPGEATWLSWSLLAYICSGLITGGMLFRTLKNNGWKIYFSLFFLTLLYFIYSPSRFA